MPRSRDFYNLTLDLAEHGTDPRDAVAVRARLRDALDTIRGPENLGGVLYIAHVPGGQLWVDVREPLELPESVELYLGAGAVLVPVVLHEGDGRDPTMLDSTAHHLRIKGSFRAPMGRAFPTLPWFRAQAGERGRSHDLATVRFTSRWMDRVHPEWWGAGDRSSASDDSDALEACVRAAVVDRVAVGATPSERLWLRVLPIELRDTYALARPLVITRGERPDDGIELRGSPGGEANPTFVCASGFPREAGAAMLAVRDFEAVTLDDVRFNGASLASVCLEMTSTREAEASADVQRRGHYLRHCGFTGARDHLVRMVITEGGSSTGTPVTTSEDLRLEGCRFTPTLGPDTFPTALTVSAPPATGVDIRGCAFDGDALAMIHAMSCALSVTNCQFRNSAVPRPVWDTDENLHEHGPEGGVDIFLDARPPGAGTGGDLATPAALYSQDCRSTSVQFLATCRAASLNTGRDCTIIGLHHVLAEVWEPVALFENLRAPPIIDYIPPDPILPRRAPVLDAQSAAVVTKPLDRKTELGDVVQPNEWKPAATAPTKPLVTTPESKPTTAPKSAWSPPGSGSFDALDGVIEGLDPNVLREAAAREATATVLPSGASRHAPVLVLSMPAPIHWRLPSTAGAWLTLTGCRFDGRYGSRPAVRGFRGCGAIGNLGAFFGASGGDSALIQMDEGDPMTVPTLGARRGP